MVAVDAVTCMDDNYNVLMIWNILMADFLRITKTTFVEFPDIVFGW